MEVIHEEQGPVDVFRISGRLDYTATAGDFDKRLRAHCARGRHGQPVARGSGLVCEAERVKNERRSIVARIVRPMPVVQARTR